MREKKLACYQTEVRGVFCPGPTSAYRHHQSEQAEIERRVVAHREARLALRRSGLPAVDPESEMFCNSRTPPKWIWPAQRPS